MARAATTETRNAEPDEFPQLADVLVRAFRSDPFHRWLFPDEGPRPRRQRLLFERVLAIYDRHGVVYTTDDAAGVALWDPPREGGPSLSELLTFVVRVLPVFGTRAWKVAQGMAPLAALHPPEPHWYLSILGTDPERQRGGVGAALLTPVLQECDEDGISAYLEASRIENVRYYERFGFEVVASLAMTSDGPVVYRMKRAPRIRSRGAE